MKHVFGMTKKTFMNRVFNEVVGSDSMATHLKAAEKFFNSHEGDEGGEQSTQMVSCTNAAEPAPDEALGTSSLREQHNWFEARLSQLASQNQYQKDDLALIPISQIKEVFEQSEKILSQYGK